MLHTVQQSNINIECFLFGLCALTAVVTRSCAINGFGGKTVSRDGFKTVCDYKHGADIQSEERA